MSNGVKKVSDTIKKTKVIIVDDHNLFRFCLKGMFPDDHPNVEVVGEADCGKTLFDVLKFTRADLVLLDIHLPDISGIEIAQRLRSEYPNLKILAVSAENASDTVRKMIDAGIDGFISKQKSDPHELTEAIRSVMDGVEYFGRDVAAIIFDLYVAKKQTTAITSEFTDREKEVIQLSGQGLLYKEIAERLNISVYTVNAHKRNIFQKLGINNTIEMVQYALKKGIIKIENN
jgi:DNA-binding NarL/FixJ family response regulator